MQCSKYLMVCISLFPYLRVSYKDSEKDHLNDFTFSIHDSNHTRSHQNRDSTVYSENRKKLNRETLSAASLSPHIHGSFSMHSKSLRAKLFLSKEGRGEQYFAWVPRVVLRRPSWQSHIL